MVTPVTKSASREAKKQITHAWIPERRRGLRGNGTAMALADRERLRGDSSGVGGVLPDSSLSPRRRPADLGQAAGLSKCRPSFTSFAPITSCAADKAVSRSDELTLRDFGGLQAPPPARRPPGS